MDNERKLVRGRSKEQRREARKEDRNKQTNKQTKGQSLVGHRLTD
jgi:hypothetical protein